MAVNNNSSSPGIFDKIKGGVTGKLKMVTDKIDRYPRLSSIAMLAVGIILITLGIVFSSMSMFLLPAGIMLTAAGLYFGTSYLMGRYPKFAKVLHKVQLVAVPILFLGAAAAGTFYAYSTLGLGFGIFVGVLGLGGFGYVTYKSIDRYQCRQPSQDEKSRAQRASERRRINRNDNVKRQTSITKSNKKN